MITLIRIMQAGARNFMRNAWLSTAATAVMTVTLTIVVISLVSNLALNRTIKGVTDKIDLSVYLKSDVTDDQRTAFENSLRNNPNVASVTYKSRAEAFEDYRNANNNDPSLQSALDTVGADATPASLQVKAKDPNELDSIIATINEPANQALVDENTSSNIKSDRRQTVDKIVRVSNFFQSTGLIASSVFLVISILIIFNTIRMAIFTRRDEIEIMKLVGATKWFIRGPFVFEAMLYGVVGAVIAMSLSYIMLLALAPRVVGFIEIAEVVAYAQTYPILIIGGEVLIGIVIGAFSSLLAMSRYLKL